MPTLSNIVRNIPIPVGASCVTVELPYHSGSWKVIFIPHRECHLRYLWSVQDLPPRSQSLRITRFHRWQRRLLLTPMTFTPSAKSDLWSSSSLEARICGRRSRPSGSVSGRKASACGAQRNKYLLVENQAWFIIHSWSRRCCNAVCRWRC